LAKYQAGASQCDLGSNEKSYSSSSTEFLQVATPMDSVYNGTGVAFVQPSPGFRSSDIGTGVDVSAKYLFHQYLVLNAGVGHLSPGAVHDS
jgi:hypothetical protein